MQHPYSSMGMSQIVGSMPMDMSMMPAPPPPPNIQPIDPTKIQPVNPEELVQNIRERLFLQEK